MQLEPPAGLLELFHSDIVFADWLILPLECGSIHVAPEGEIHFKLEVVVLLLTVSLDEDV
jgi:hypothetical protein